MADEFILGLGESKKDIDKLNESINKTIELLDKASTKGKGFRLADSVKSYKEFEKESVSSITNVKKSYTDLQNHINTMAKNQNGLEATTRKQIAYEKSMKRAFDRQTELSRSYVKLNARRVEARKRLQDLIASEKASNKQIKLAQKEFDRLNAKVNKANVAVSNFSKTGLGAATKGITNLLGAFGVIGGLTIFANQIKSAFNLARKLDSLNFTMQSVIENSEVLERTQFFLKETAEKYGASIVVLTERYNKFYTAARQSGVALEDTEAIFKSFTKSAGFLGLRSHELEGVFLALEQMLSKGKVTTEELRRQLGERLPGAFGVMADTVNKLNPDIEVTVEVLDDMLKKGEVLSHEVLPEFARQYEKAIGITQKDRVETLNASMERLSNSWVNFVGEVTEGEGAISKAMVSVIDWFGKAIEGFNIMVTSSNDLQKAFNKSLEGKFFKEVSEAYKEMGKDAEDVAINDLTRTDNRITAINAEVAALRKRNTELKGKGLKGRAASSRAVEFRNNEEALERLNQELSKNIGINKAAEKQLGINTESENKDLDSKRTLKKVISELADAQTELMDSTADEAPQILRRINALKKEKEAWENNKKARNKISPLEFETPEEVDSKFKEYAEEMLAVLEKHFGVEAGKIDPIELPPLDVDGFMDDVDAAAQRLARKGFIKDAFEGVTDQLGISSDALAEVFDGIENGFDRSSEALVAFGNLAAETFGAIMELENQRLDVELSRIDAEEEKALTFAENDAAIANIEAQADERRAAIQTKQAKNEKSARVVSSVAGTANAVVNALGMFPFTPANIALAATVGSLGLAQTAIIASQKIPEFRDGVRGFEGGLAVVGDGGVNEFVKTPSGDIFKTPSTDTLVNLPKGSDVFKNEDDFLKDLTKITDFNCILFNKGMFDLSSLKPSLNIEQNSVSRQDMDAILGKHISKLELSNLTIDENGFTKRSIKGYSSTVDFNKRVNFKGKNV